MLLLAYKLFCIRFLHVSVAGYAHLILGDGGGPTPLLCGQGHTAGFYVRTGVANGIEFATSDTIPFKNAVVKPKSARLPSKIDEGTEGEKRQEAKSKSKPS